MTPFFLAKRKHDDGVGVSEPKKSSVEAMPSKVILMMPKNQELSKFQRFKNQVSRIKIQE